MADSGLRGILEEKKLDFALFCNLDSTKIDPNMFYFSGYRGLGALIIPRKQTPFLIAPKMELQRARKSMVKKVYSMEKKRFFESIYNIARKNSIARKKIAIDNSSFTLNHHRYLKKQFKSVKTKDISLDCLRLRQVKSKKEMQFLKKSCDYAGRIFTKTIKSFKDFKTEADVAAFLEYEAKRQGLEIALHSNGL